MFKIMNLKYILVAWPHQIYDIVKLQKQFGIQIHYILLSVCNAR